MSWITKFNEAMANIDTFCDWEIDDSETIYIPGQFANSNWFIKLGEVCKYCDGMFYVSLGWSAEHPNELCINKTCGDWNIIIKKLNAMEKTLRERMA